jgi:hypothetical protein
MDIALLILGTLAALFGAVLLYASLRPDERWDSRWVRSIVVVSGVGWFAVGALFFAAALAEGGTRTALLIAGGAAGVATAACRWLIRDRWEARQLGRPGES